MSDTLKDIYVVRYACSDGILHGRARMERSRPQTKLWLSSTDWVGTEAEARVAAEAMRQKKLASLRKQLARLEKLNFATAPIVEKNPL